MTSGLRALIETIDEEPLAYSISAYVGQLLMSGTPAPPGAFYGAGRDHLLRQIWNLKEVRQIRNEGERTLKYQELAEIPLRRIVDAQHAELQRADTHELELTLVNVTVMPAIGAQGTQSGGHWLPAARIPYNSLKADLELAKTESELEVLAATRGRAAEAAALEQAKTIRDAQP